MLKMQIYTVSTIADSLNSSKNINAPLLTEANNSSYPFE